MKKQQRGGVQKPPPADEPAAAVHSNDPRFAAVHSNPRFARFPKAKSRVEIDQRFSGVFDDPKFKRQTVVDKRGRATGAKERTDDLRRFYRLPEEDAAKAEEAAEEAEGDDDDDDASGSDLSEEQGAAPAREGARRGIRGSVSVSSSSSDEDEESEEEGSGEEGVLAQFVSGEEDIPLIDETHRLAVVDLEWERMRAVDIFAVLRSFLPSGGRIVRVTVYPSDFGLARMKEEEEHGPRGAFASAVDGDSDDEETAGLDAEKLRVYERERLRFYYAIVECDSAATAASLYKQCDGLEFERSSTRLDLRYVPDEQTFAGREPRDVALAVPSEYTPVDYTTKALQQTRVTLTWDADDPERKKQLRRKLTSEQLRDEDFAAYLGSGSEDEQDEGEKESAARLRNALLGGVAAGGGGGGARPAEDGSDEDDPAPGSRAARRAPRDDDMIVTFGVGLEERIAAKRAAATQPPETVWEAHLRERKAKKRAAKDAAAAGGGTQNGDGGADAEADLGFDDPFFAAADDGGGAARRKKKGGLAKDAAPAADAAAARDDARRRAELELLLLDDARLKAGAAPLKHGRGGAREEAAAADGDEAQLSRKEARAAAKAARKAARLARTRGGTDGDGAELDTADPRFTALFTRPDFALDPTDSRFKAVRSVDAIRREAAARRAGPPADADAAGPHAADGEDRGFSSVVAKLKRKAMR